MWPRPARRAREVKAAIGKIEIPGLMMRHRWSPVSSKSPWLAFHRATPSAVYKTELIMGATRARPRTATDKDAAPSAAAKWLKASVFTVKIQWR